MSLDFGNGVDSVKIKILTTNSVDATLLTDPNMKGKVIQPMKEVIGAIAEHGLSMSIKINNKNILYDFGGLGFTVLKNLPIFQINPEIFDKCVLSHGHFDHFGSMFKLAPKLGENKEIIVSPDIYQQKIAYLATSGDQISLEELTKNFKTYKREGKAQQLPGIKKKLLDKMIEDNNLKLIETKIPIELGPGIWTSGEIELFDKSELSSNLFLKIDKTTFKEETFRDEIAIYIMVKDKGLIVLTGCGHTGIINIIKHGKKISGINKIYAVIGGFHLNWSTDEHIEKVVNYFKEIKPEIICGMHCTGFNFNKKMMTEMPKNTTLGVVGTEFHL